MKNAITSYRELDLEKDIPGRSHIEGLPVKNIPVLTKHDRKQRLRTMKKEKIPVDTGREFGSRL